MFDTIDVGLFLTAGRLGRSALGHRSQLLPRFGRARIPAVLAIYKRHASPCPQKSRQYRPCNRPCWVEGTVEGKYYRKSLKTRNWERATKLAREIEEGKKPRVTITEATDAFVRDAEARGLRPASVYKYRLLFKQLKAFSEKGRTSASI
jgi:hypothetical protein